jgi:broad specificity phosphatase PhoE
MNTIKARFLRHAEGTHMLNPDLIAGRSVEAIITADGELHARRKGVDLSQRNIYPDYVISSSAVRCIQTGEAVLRAMNLAKTIETTDDLLEMDQGNFVGRRRDEVYTEDVRHEIDRLGKDFALPGGESMNQVGARGMEWLRTQETRFNNVSVDLLIIAHVGLITHTVGQIEQWSQRESLDRLRSMPPLSETLVIFNGTDWKVEEFARPI